MTTLIVAPWGDPGGWRPASYEVEVPGDKEPVGKGVGKFRSSAGALASAFGDAHLLVFILNTLCARASAEPGTPLKYVGVAEAARGYVLGCIRECSGEGDRTPYLPEGLTTEVVVLPGVGTFKDKSGVTWRFRGGLESYMVGVYIKTLRAMEELKPERVVLDLTHGINYMPVLTAEAVSLAVDAHSACSGRGLELLVYNSDPVAGSQEGVPELRVNLVKRVKVGPKEAKRRLLEGCRPYLKDPRSLRMMEMRRPKKILEERLKWWNELLKEVARSMCSLLPILDYALVLYLVQYARDDLETLIKSREDLEDLLSLPANHKYLQELGARVEDGPDRVEVVQPFDVRVDAAYLHSASLALEAASGMIIGLGGVGEISLDDLRRTVKALPLAPAPKTMVEREVDNIGKRVRAFVERCGRSLDAYVPYYRIYRSTWFEGGEVKVECSKFGQAKEGQVDERNFIAHAGMESHLVEVAYKDGRVLIRYREERRDELEKITVAISQEFSKNERG